jgi:hypothetical protein
MSETYNIEWLKKATFEELDAAMNDVTTRRLVEPVLRTPQGEAIAKGLIEGAKSRSESSYNMAWLETATYEQLKAALKDANARPQLEKLMRTPKGANIASQLINGTRPQPEAAPVVATPEEQAQIDADTARADAEAAEAARITAEEATRNTPPAASVEEKKKIVVDYQVTDEKGVAIGRPTHIEGWTNEEVIEKLKAAHVNAVRYAERIKKSQLINTQAVAHQDKVRAEVKKFEEEANEALEVATKEKDPAKLQDAIKKVSKAEREAQIAREALEAQGRIIGKVWMEDHKDDFQPCDASSNIIGAWLRQNNREFTYENLELAYEATKHQLPAPTRQAVEEVPAAQVENPPAAATTAPAAPAASITPPAAAAAAPVSTATPPAVTPPAAATAPSSTPVAATNTPAARRPGVNGSLPPGSLSAQRPSEQAAPQTTTRAELMKSIAKMPPTEYRKKLQTSKEFRDQLVAAGIIDAAYRA